MKTESLREVKNNLSRVIDDLPKTGAVLITRRGRTKAVLLPVDESTDLELLVLSQNKRLWDLIDRSLSSGKKRARTRFDELPE